MALMKQCAPLRKSVDHGTSIIVTQQDHARVSCMLEI
jgi:uncharacterized protein YheU (UPF0270 family)